MISVLDDGIGTVVTALKNKGVLANTIIFLYVDNGAGTKGAQGNYGSNYPLRGVCENLNCFRNLQTFLLFTAKEFTLGRCYEECWVLIQSAFEGEPVHLQRLFPHLRHFANFGGCG